MGSKLLTIFVLMCLALPVSAQTLIPATSEDLSDFDRQVSQSLRKTTQSGDFNQAVTEEAKKLGTSVKAEAGKAKKANSKAAAAKAAKDAKASSPANNDRGNSSNAPGQMKKSN